jgi:hypothetical protein
MIWTGINWGIGGRLTRSCGARIVLAARVNLSREVHPHPLNEELEMTRRARSRTIVTVISRALVAIVAVQGAAAILTSHPSVFWV